ncbi:MAG: hypothetical protein SGJ11_07595 [Phycisphaerae bacterium]|nr:hypothetical protein [Phycisphaerae bacterium]
MALVPSGLAVPDEVPDEDGVLDEMLDGGVRELSEGFTIRDVALLLFALPPCRCPA